LALSRYINGVIDEVLIFNRALSADEIAFLYKGSPYGGGNSKRRVDRSKVRNTVIVDGVDLQGNKISGSSGTGLDTQVLVQMEPADQTTLDAQAVYALSELSSEGAGAKINLPIAIGAYLKPGDTLPLRIQELALNNYYRIQKISKSAYSVSISPEKSFALLETLLNKVQTASLQQIANRAGVTYTRSASTSAQHLLQAEISGIRRIWAQTGTIMVLHLLGSNSNQSKR